MSETEINCAGIFDYQAYELENVSECNLCGSFRKITIATKDRYGFQVNANLCLGCGVIYLGPRLTKLGYSVFYKNAYRKLVSKYLGKQVDVKTIQQEQMDYAKALYNFLENPILSVFSGELIRILDIGGSTGVVSDYIRRELLEHGINSHVTVLDPSPDELAEAERRGCVTIPGFIEDLRLEDVKWDLVLMCQTIDHLLDPRRSIEKVIKILSDNGVFFCDIVDWQYVSRRKGIIKSIKTDHPYNFTRGTAWPLFTSIGFEIIDESVIYDNHLLGFLCKKKNNLNSACRFSAEHAKNMFDFIREQQARDGPF